MRYTLILLSFFLFACNEEEEVIDRNIYTLELRYDGDRLTFKQISLPDNLFNVNSGNQTFDVVGLSDTNDIRITLTFDCDVGARENLNEELLVNFYDDMRTVLIIDRVVTCNPTIQVIYE